MTAEPKVIEFTYGSHYNCERCKATHAVRVLADTYGDYFSCLICGMVAYPEQFSAVIVLPNPEQGSTRSPGGINH